MDYQDFIEWLSYLAQQIRSFLGRKKRRRLTEKEESARIEEAEKIMMHALKENEALQAAKAGEGPQPWDQDWFENTENLTQDVMELASKAGWHRLQHFREILAWALASPQGQRAIASMQDCVGPDPTNPWHEPLVILANLYICAQKASHKMLREQAKGLHYSEELKSELDHKLRKLLSRNGTVVSA